MRIMHDLTGSGGPISAIDMYGGITTPADGAAHMIGVTYDGSSTAAGVKIYVDGVADTSTTIKIDNLNASIVTATTGPMLIGYQPSTFGEIVMSHFAFSSVVRSAGYMTAANSYANRPAVDGSNTLYFDFTEGTGTTLVDKSSNGYNGTITGSAAWY